MPHPTERRRTPRFHPGPETWVSFSFEGARYSGLRVNDLSEGGASVALPLALRGRIRPTEILEHLVLAHPELKSLTLHGVVVQSRPQEVSLAFRGLSEEAHRCLAATAWRGRLNRAEELPRM